MIENNRDPVNLKPTVHVVHVAEVKCYLCGTTAGWLELEPGKAAMFRRAGDGGSAVRRIPPIQCARCGGATFVEGIESIRRREEIPPVPWERPRRGRHPKRLVDTVETGATGGAATLPARIDIRAETAEIEKKQ